MHKGHTSREFDRELRQLRDKLLDMGGRAEQQIALAVQALVKRDVTLAQSVIDADAQIDREELAIDELAFLILARRQPVASDLRFVMLAVKVVTDLERIGDLAVNIAKRVRDLVRFAPSALQERIELLGQRVLAALQLALDAFVHEDAERAEKVIEGDRDIDALNMHVIADILATGEGNDVGEVARVLALSSVSRYLERIGDHATNIAEMVIYFVRGRDVRHHIARPRGG